MDVAEVLRALKAKEITPDEAKKRLAGLNGGAHSQKTAKPQEKAGWQLPKREKIAVIGMSGRFPKARTLDEYWRNLAEGRDCISEIGSDRWDVGEYFDRDHERPGKTYSKWMGLLDDPDLFDPLFFTISPLEAELMDPQQRVFMECAWHCLEDAGLKPSLLSGKRCGVFVGCTSGDYRERYREEELNAYSLTGMHPSILSARLSYFLNLKGPTVAVDTACSSSLVALSQACDSLLLHNCDLALAGGVCILSGPSVHIMTSKMEVISPDGHCYTFDNRANGYVPGEGVGAVALKRLSDAERDHDTIYGVIAGWGVNQDGKTNGITAPSVKSQSALEKEVYERFGIDPETITCIEAHGTGTKLGDPIEVEALIDAFRGATDKKQFCALGSVKSNIGHLMNAAGISGVLKLLLSLRNRMIPPTINFKTLNEHIDLENTPFYVNTELRPWQSAAGIPRRSAVSSFSFSGTNAHLVIEEYLGEDAEQNIQQKNGNGDASLFVLSAKTREQLVAYAALMKEFCNAHNNLSLEAICGTLQSGRDEMAHRLALVVSDSGTLCRLLDSFVNGGQEKIVTGFCKNDDDPDPQQIRLAETLCAAKKYQELAELWIGGVPIEWHLLYENGEMPRKISLPGYPFAREHYWLEKQPKESAKKDAVAQIHPLLHQNRSQFSGIRFITLLTGNEFFLRDHQVQQQKILPGVAYLEMARAAFYEASDGEMLKDQVIVFKNLVWIAPLFVNSDPVPVEIALVSENRSTVLYEVYVENIRHEETICHQGEIVVRPKSSAGRRGLPLVSDAGWMKIGTHEEYYRIFREMGIEYGAAHQGVIQLYKKDQEIVAQLSLPEAAGESAPYVLHPALMDAALQSTLGFMMGQRHEGAAVPFALDELVIHKKCTSNMWAFSKRHGTATSATYDIDLCDETGHICIVMRGLSVRIIDRKGGAVEHAPLSLDLLLSQLQEGTLDIENAELLLHKTYSDRS